MRPELIPLLPLPAGLVVQAVHADDVGEAYRLAATDERARGAYNVAAEPVLDAAALGRALGARPCPCPSRAVRAAADLTWRARLQPTPPGWLDMGMAVPVMDAGRIRRELGWAPRKRADEALLELLEGMRDGAGRRRRRWPGTGGPARLREFAHGRRRTGLGAGATGVPPARVKRRAGRSRSPTRAWRAGVALERRRVRRVAAQQPRAVGAADELVALGELAERGRDGRPARADELAEDPVGERERDHDALAADAAPALGEVPEQRLQAAVDARELRDRLRRGEPQRALARGGRTARR